MRLGPRFVELPVEVPISEYRPADVIIFVAATTSTTTVPSIFNSLGDTSSSETATGTALV